MATASEFVATGSEPWLALTRGRMELARWNRAHFEPRSVVGVLLVVLSRLGRQRLRIVNHGDCFSCARKAKMRGDPSSRRRTDTRA